MYSRGFDVHLFHAQEVVHGGGCSGWRGEKWRDRRCSDIAGPSSRDSGVARTRFGCLEAVRKVDIRLPGKRDSNSHGARSVY